MSRPILSTHVLDTSTGTPGSNIHVELFKKTSGSKEWTQWHSAMTSPDGRIQFPFSKESMAAGTYKLGFNVGEYYGRIGKKTIYDIVETDCKLKSSKCDARYIVQIVFKTEEDQHYHIPLLLSPYGYSTYRGS